MSRIVNGIKHDGRCACPVCDPEDTKLKAQRARYLAEQRTAAAAPPAVLAKSPGARPLRFRRPPSDDTRRLSQLLREGKTFPQAAEIIEAERQQKGDPI